ncbi:MAG: ribonuclease H-like domain-containing protein [Emergencia sp.]
MKKITDTLNIPHFASRLLDMYFGGRPFAVFDIETTGLSPADCKVILSGFLLAEGDRCEVVQFFASQQDDEKELLTETFRVLGSVDYVITYNGRHFDIPFIQKRALRHGIDASPAETVCDLDLYQVVSGHSPLRQALPSLSQKNLERFCGLASGRDDEISGGESVELYHRYMQTESFDLERRILLHNHDDLIQLYRLLPVISKTDFHRAMFRMGFPAGNVLINRITVRGRDLCVQGRQMRDPVSYISFPAETAPYSLLMNAADGQAELTVPCQCQAGALYFDVQTVLGPAFREMEKYPSVVNGYLIVQDHGTISHMEINAFVKLFFETRI